MNNKAHARAVEFLLVVSVCLLMLVISCAVQAAEPTPAVERAVKIAAKKHHFDPQFILAIIEVESNFNPNTRGSHGEIGLMQLRPEFHPNVTSDITLNVALGTAYLADLRALCMPRYLSAWFVCFNVGPNRRLIYPHNFPYYRKVKHAYERRKALTAISETAKWLTPLGPAPKRPHALQAASQLGLTLPQHICSVAGANALAASSDTRGGL